MKLCRLGLHKKPFMLVRCDGVTRMKCTACGQTSRAYANFHRFEPDTHKHKEFIGFTDSIRVRKGQQLRAREQGDDTPLICLLIVCLLLLPFILQAAGFWDWLDSL